MSGDFSESLETRRLILRVPKTGDGKIINATVLASINELKRWWLWAKKAPTLDESEAVAIRESKLFQNRDKLAYLIFLKGTGEHVGSISLGHFDWVNGTADFAYFGSTRHAGNGYISESLRRLVECAFQTLGLKRLEIRTDERNMKSRRVAENCGFTLEKIMSTDELDPEGNPYRWCVYTRLR